MGPRLPASSTSIRRRWRVIALLTSRPLAHIVLRQVEWSVRHYPAAPATQRHLHLARLIIEDIGEPGSGR
jgi:hypothetical protein